MTFVSDLEPKALWRHFDTILTIPRGSKNEEQMRQYVIKLAEQHNLNYKTDKAGNVVVRKPASTGHDKAPVIVLQAHLDMVNEKNSDVEHDFSKDAIKPQRDGDYLTARGTTLGSDNGIGVAAMLAILEDRQLTHGPLELLFTIDEETGLTGATDLAPDMLEGRILLNLDTEEDGAFYVGCAGGGDSNLTLPLKFAASPEQAAAIQLKLHGLKGGHSGVDIHLQRGNAVKLLARALQATYRKTPFLLTAFTGGDKHNAIPREAFATLMLPKNVKTAFGEMVTNEIDEIRREFKAAEPAMKLTIEDAPHAADAWDRATSENVLNLINALPHGVLSMSYDIPGLVETSTNLASVRAIDGDMHILMSTRSSVDSALRATRQRIRSIASLAGARVKEGNGYPGWQPNVNSPLLKKMVAVHEKVTGKKPVVKAVHAGLECGIIGEKYPGMDMISLGPQIEYPHSPDERVKISTVKTFYQLLQAALTALA